MKFKLKLIHNNVILTLVKVKVTLEQATMAQRGSRCIALLCLQPRCQMGAGGQRHAPAAVPPGKSPVSIVQEAEWASGPVWTGRKDLAPPGFDPGPSSLQRVAVRTELKIKKYVCMYVCVCVCMYIQSVVTNYGIRCQAHSSCFHSVYAQYKVVPVDRVCL